MRRDSATIFALSSAPGRAGIAVVRVSGPRAGAAIEALTGRPLPEPRHAALRSVFAPGQPSEQDRIDEALVLWFAAPHSATGEDVGEFHLHGGSAIVEAVLAALAAIPGLRPAERGEFTRRAVENGKLDLTQAEGLADLIDAETPAQRRLALAHYDGALLRHCEDWRARLLRLCAWAEAEIDFADEELDENLGATVREGARELLADIRAALADGRRGEIVREGFHLAVIGPPNAGKSSLLNMLARREVAIVAPTPGTTRDVVEARLDLGGYLVIAADTAGLREATDAIETEGVRRALARAESADLAVLVLDGSAQAPHAGLPESFARDGDAVLTVWNKCDLDWPSAREGLRISVRSGEGIDTLLAALTTRIGERLGRTARESPLIARARHRHALEQALEALARATAATAPELAAEDLRLALRAIGRLTGRVDIEELLDVVFRDFCIGK
ncbi:MAG TPA: tRNA uridine-5-carboxymethylaminomethyl(34) synthesis GTPase MnmE [Rhizomicrobium sp.]